MLYDPAPPKVAGRTAPGMILPQIFGHCVCERVFSRTSLLANGEQSTQGLQKQEIINPLSLTYAHILFSIHWCKNLQLLFFIQYFPFFSYGLEMCIQNRILHACLWGLPWSGIQKENANRNREKHSWRQQFQCYTLADANRDSSLHIINKDKICNVFQNSTLISVLALLHQKHPTVSDTNRRGCLSSVLCKNQQNTEWSSERPYFFILQFWWRRRV